MLLNGSLKRPIVLAAAALIAAATFGTSPVLAHPHHDHYGIGFGFYNPYPYEPAPVVVVAPPAVAVAPAPVVVVPVTPTCQTGQFKRADGAIVSGTACQQPDGTWRLSQ